MDVVVVLVLPKPSSCVKVKGPSPQSIILSFLSKSLCFFPIAVINTCEEQCELGWAAGRWHIPLVLARGGRGMSMGLSLVYIVS